MTIAAAVFCALCVVTGCSSPPENAQTSGPTTESSPTLVTAGPLPPDVPNDQAEAEREEEALMLSVDELPGDTDWYKTGDPLDHFGHYVCGVFTEPVAPQFSFTQQMRASEYEFIETIRLVGETQALAIVDAPSAPLWPPAPRIFAPSTGRSPATP